MAEHRSALRPEGGSTRPAVLAAAWVVLASTWGALGTQLDLNGPPHPTTAADVVCLALFVTSVAAALPIGALVGRRGFGTLLWLAAVGTAAEELCYFATMLASPDPTSDTTGAAFAIMSTGPMYGLLLALLAAGMGISRLFSRRSRTRPTRDGQLVLERP